MELNELKKKLYKENPKAKLIQIVKGMLNYVVRFENDPTVLRILVPVSDMGDASFYPEMEAKLLIRWIIKQYEDNS